MQILNRHTRRQILWLPHLSVVIFLLVFNERSYGVTVDDGSVCTIEVGLQCPPGMNLVYQDMAGASPELMCCEADKKAEKDQRIRAMRCRPTDCVKSGHHGITGNLNDICSSSEHLTQRVTNGKLLDYDNFMEERCSTGNGNLEDGVRALCCPKGSRDAYLVSNYGAEPNEFPHMAKLATPGHCGATVYNKRFVITAAHCVVDDFDGVVTPADEIMVSLAGSDIGEIDSLRQVYRVNRVIPHEHYSKLRGSPEREHGYMREFNDIALLELDEDIEFGDNVKALQIAPSGFSLEKYGYQAVVLGWGRNERNFEWTHLQKSNFLWRNDSACFDVLDGYWWTMGDKDHQYMCMGGIRDGHWGPIVGRGDGGGPAICRDGEGHPVLCGLVSFGPPHKKCMDERSKKNCPPSVFTDVEYFHDWIRQNAGEQDPRTIYRPYLYGREITERTYEHQVHITSDRGDFCGGTLVAQDVVVTAAQCVFHSDDQTGSFNENMRDGLLVTAANGHRLRVDVAQHLPHFRRRWPQWNKNLGKVEHQLTKSYYYQHDLAVLKLREKVNIDPERLARLPREADYSWGGKEVAYSYGEEGRNPKLLERAFMILSPGDCRRRLDRLEKLGMRVEDDLLCGVEVYSGGSTCDRELGGGLICQKVGGRDTLCGVQVFRFCERSYPNLFINLGYQTSSGRWLQDAVNLLS